MGTFKIRDYCIAMTFDGQPQFHALDLNVEITTEKSDGLLDPLIAHTEENPWQYRFKKHLYSERSSIRLDFLNYKQWHRDD